MAVAWRFRRGVSAAAAILLAALGVALSSQAQTQTQAQAQVSHIDDIDAERMRRVLPAAGVFAPAQSELRIYAGYAGHADPGNDPPLVGYVFFTPDLPPEEIGYSAPIDMLVGMDVEGAVTGLEIVHYTESYKAIRGDFIQSEGFPRQFTGMNISGGFRVGRDIDGISRATITAWAVARGIRNAARRVALEHLPHTNYARSTNADGSIVQ